MASGGGFQRPNQRSLRSAPSSEQPNRRTWKRSNSTADGDETSSMASNPLEARPNNWDFSDWQPNTSLEATKRRKKAKANPERQREKDREKERERTLSQESTPRAEKFHRTPSTFPKVKGSTASQRLALENLRQHMTFADLDDVSTDGERNNERLVPIRRDRPANYTCQDMGSTLDGGAMAAQQVPVAQMNDQRVTNNRNNNREDKNKQEADGTWIVGRLMQIRDQIKQATALMESLQKSSDPSDREQADKLQLMTYTLKMQERNSMNLLLQLSQRNTKVEKLHKLTHSLKEHERAYKGLLQELLALQEADNATLVGSDVNTNIESGTSASALAIAAAMAGGARQSSQNVKPELMDETTSVDFEVQSQISDTTTERTQSSSSRPRIEDKLGVDSDDAEEDALSQGSDNSDRPAAAAQVARLRQGIGVSSAGTLHDTNAAVAAILGEPEWDYLLAQCNESDAAGDGLPLELRQNRDDSENLLLKLVEQQEELRALQGRQQMLLALHKNAEKRLSAAKTKRSQVVDSMNQVSLSEPVSNTQPPDASPGGAVDALEGATGGSSQPQGFDSTSPGISQFRQRLEDLRKNIYDVKADVSSSEPVQLTPGADGSLTDSDRKQLEDKLRDLQRKKDHMDAVINELQTLRSIKVGMDCLEEPTMPTSASADLPSLMASFGMPPSQAPLSPTVAATTALVNISHDSDITESQQQPVKTAIVDKLQKLQDLRSKFDQLRDLMQHYQGSVEASGQSTSDAMRQANQQQQDDDNDDDDSSVPGYSDTDDKNLSMRRNLRQPEHSKGGSGSKVLYNKRKNKSTDVKGRHTQPLPPPPPSPPQLINDEFIVWGAQAMSENSMSETAETLSQAESLGPWGDDPELLDRVNKLQDMKKKLNEMMATISPTGELPSLPGAQQPPPVMVQLPRRDKNKRDDNRDDDDGDDETPRPRSKHASDTNLQSSSAAVSGGTTRHDARAGVYATRHPTGSPCQHPQSPPGIDEFEYEMVSQLRELENLKDEREKLLVVRAELQRFNHNNQTSENEPARGSSTRVVPRNNTEVKFAPTAPIVHHHHPENAAPPQTVTFASNDELYGKIRKQRILREELRQKKRELEDIMRKDKPKKQYSRNQDNQSDTVSYSTEAFGTSVISADATMATWGGSTAENLESITEDASQGAEEEGDEDEDEDDDYPSDGIAQAEEEEEENDQSGETYTIESERRQRSSLQAAAAAAQRRGQGPLGAGARPKLKPGRQTYPRSLSELQAGKNNLFKMDLSTLNNQRSTRPRQENFRAAADIIQEDEAVIGSQLIDFKQKLESTNALCQSLLREHQGMNELLQRSISTSNLSSSPYRNSGMYPDPLQQQQQQQQQNLMFYMNQCYQQMAMQQMEIQSLYGRLQGLSLYAQLPGDQVDGGDTSPQISPTANVNTSTGSTQFHPTLMGSSAATAAVYNYQPFPSPFAMAFNPMMTMPSTTPLPPPSATGPNPFTFNPQFPPNFAFINNPYGTATAPNSGYDPNLLQVKRENVTPVEVGRAPQSRPEPRTNNLLNPIQSSSLASGYAQQANTNSHNTLPIPLSRNLLSGDDGTGRPSSSGYTESKQALDNVGLPQDKPRHRIMSSGREKPSSSGLVSIPRIPVEMATKQKRPKQGVKVKKEKCDGDTVHRESYPSSRAEAAASLASRQRYNDALYRPGLSAGISGAGFGDTTSQSSAVSSAINPETRQQLSAVADQMDSEPLLEEQIDNSVFEDLRETIYSEVAALISQNEKRPNFLIEIFRELQLLKSDFLRQRALYSIQDIVARYLTDDAPVTDSLPEWLRRRRSLTASELTPSESILTLDDSDGDDERRNTSKELSAAAANPAHHLSSHQTSASLAAAASASNNFPATLAAAASLSDAAHPLRQLVGDDDEYDFTGDQLEDTSSSSAGLCWESPFARDSLGDTIIHADKFLQQVREYQQQQHKTDDVSSATAKPLRSKLLSFHESEKQSTPVASQEGAATTTLGAEAAGAELNVGNELGAETSTEPSNLDQSISSLIPHIDMARLNNQMQAIMTEVIMFVKDNKNEICTSQLILFVRQLIISLTRHMVGRHEMSQFFHRQLSSTLTDQLSKYFGRRISDCLEDFVMEISDILMNELAFFSLMQDLQSPAKLPHMFKGASGADPAAATATAFSDQRLVSYEDESSSGNDSDESSSDNEDDNDDDDDDEDDDDNDDEGGQDGAIRHTIAMDDGEDQILTITANEVEDLGKLRDDALANQLAADDIDDDAESGISPGVIQLVPSETKPFTRIGSDEDEDDEDESLSAEDPSETAVSRHAEQERSDLMDDGDGQPGHFPSSRDNGALLNTYNFITTNHVADAIANNMVDLCLDGMNGSENSTTKLTNDSLSSELSQDGSVVVVCGAADAGDERKDDNTSWNTVVAQDGEAVIINGEVHNGDDVTVDDVPTKLSVMSESELQNRMSEEQSSTSGAAGILTTFPDNDLAGDEQALKEPDCPT